MIARVWGKNFGVLKNFDVALEPLTLLAGPNASGKSTFLRAARCLASVVRGPLYRKGGPSAVAVEVTWEQLVLGDFTKPTILGVETEAGRVSGSYEVTIGRIGGRIAILDEKIECKGTTGKQFRFNSSTPEMDFGRGDSSTLPRTRSLPFISNRYRSDPKWAEVVAPLGEFVDTFSPFFVFRFSPGQLAVPVGLATQVRPDGYGFVAAMDTLAGEDPKGYAELVSRLTTEFKFLKQVRVVPAQSVRTGEPIKLLMFEREGGVDVPGEFESDGVLLTLAYMWLAYCPRYSKTEVFPSAVAPRSLGIKLGPAIGIEEPETGAHAALLPNRIATLRALVEGNFGRPPVQVIASTHSAALLRAIGDIGNIRDCALHGDGSGEIRVPNETNIDAYLTYWAREIHEESADAPKR